MMPDLRVYEGEFLVLQKRTMLLMIQICQDHEKFSDGLMNLQMPSFMQRPKVIIDSFITKCWISGLSDRFEPGATAAHLTNIENFLIGQREVLTILLALTKAMLIGRN